MTFASWSNSKLRDLMWDVAEAVEEVALVVELVVTGVEPKWLLNMAECTKLISFELLLLVVSVRNIFGSLESNFSELLFCVWIVKVSYCKRMEAKNNNVKPNKKKRKKRKF